MADVTAFGSFFTLISSIYPMGIIIDEGADDVALFEIDDPEIGTVNVGLNGHKISWSKASVYTMRISVFANGEQDRKLKALMAYNRVQFGSAYNVDTIQGVFTEGITGTKTIFPDLTITVGALSNSTTTEGRFATRTYTLSGTIQAY